MEETLITTVEAAARLGITPIRVRQLIKAGRLPSQQFGRDHVIREADLALVADRKPGRPKKADEALLPAETPIAVAEMEAGDVAMLPLASAPARTNAKKANGAAKATTKKRAAKKEK